MKGCTQRVVRLSSLQSLYKIFPKPLSENIVVMQDSSDDCPVQLLISCTGSFTDQRMVQHSSFYDCENKMHTCKRPFKEHPHNINPLSLNFFPPRGTHSSQEPLKNPILLDYIVMSV